MQDFMNAIAAGELSIKQILEQLNQIHNESCDEHDVLVDRIEELEGQATLNQLAMLELKDKYTNTLAKCKQQAKSIDIIEKKALEAVAHASDFQNKLTVAEAKLKLMEPDSKELKRTKVRMKRLTAANQSHQKGRKVLKANFKKLKDELALMCRENAKLRMTGHKQVGKYNFTIFPVKVDTDLKERKIGLVVYNNEGAMKVLTRHSETGEIVQPKSHNFRFSEVESTWINEFFDVVDAHDHRFDDAVLRLVK